MRLGVRRSTRVLVWASVAVTLAVLAGAAVVERQPAPELAGSGVPFTGTVLDITGADRLRADPAATDTRLGVVAGRPVTVVVGDVGSFVAGASFTVEVVRVGPDLLSAVGDASIAPSLTLAKNAKSQDKGDNGKDDNGKDDTSKDKPKCPPGQEHDAKPDKYPPGQAKKGCPRPPSG